DFHARVALEVLRARLQIVEGAREAGIAALRALAQRAEDDANLDLAREIWRDLAETLADLPE
ncbi:XRE family transcriptional regulator, partial [Kitasatospora sp. NPDC058965]